MPGKILFVVLIWWILAGAQDFIPISLYNWKGETFKAQQVVQRGDSLFLLSENNSICVFNTRNYRMTYYSFPQQKFKLSDVQHVEVRNNGEFLLTTSKGLFTYSIPTGQCRLLNPLIPDEKLVMSRAFEQYVFILLTNRLLLYDGKTVKGISIQRPGVIKHFRQIVLSDEGEIWLLGDEGVLQISGDRQILYSRNNLFREKLLLMYKSNAGHLFLMTQKNIWRWGEAGWKQMAKFKEGNRIFVDYMGMPWVYGEGSLYIYDKGTMVPVQIPRVVLDSRILGMFLNSRFELFVVTPEQIFLFRNFMYSRQQISGHLFNKSKTLLKLSTWQLFPELFHTLQKSFPEYSRTEKTEFLNSEIDYYLATQKGNGDFREMIEQTLELEKESTQKAFPVLLRTLFFQSDPEMAIYYQQKQTQQVTRPTQIVDETYELGRLYHLNGNPELAYTIFQNLVEKYSISSPSTDWILLYLARHTQQANQAEKYWEFLNKNAHNPVVVSFCRFHNYASFARNYVLKHVDSVLKVQSYPADVSVSSFCADENGVWFVNTNNQLYFLDPSTGEQKRIPQGSQTVKAISTRIGVLVLKRNGGVRLATPERVQPLNPNPAGSENVLDIWVNQGTPFLHTFKRIYYFDGELGTWRNVLLPQMIRGFDLIKILPGLNQGWYVVTTNNVYVMNPENSQVESLSLPGEIIRIFDVVSEGATGMYFATNAGLYHFMDNQWQKVTPSDGYWGEKVRKLEGRFSPGLLLVPADSTVYLKIKNLWLCENVLQQDTINTVIDATLAPNGDVWMYTPQGFRLWKRAQADGNNIALNAIRTADFLWKNQQYQKLVTYLDRFTVHPLLEQWAHEFRARSYLQLQKYDEAYEEYRLGLKLNKKNPWINDTTLIALMYAFHQAGSWDNLLKTADLFMENFPQSRHLKFMHRMLFRAAMEGNWDANLSHRLKMVQWLVAHDANGTKNARLQRLYHVMLMRYYYGKHTGAVQFLEKATQLLPDSDYALFWQYLILQERKETMKPDLLQEQIRTFMEPISDRYLRKLYGRLLMESWLLGVFHS